MIIRQYDYDISRELLIDTLEKMGFRVSRIEEGHDMYYSNTTHAYTENDIKLHVKKKMFDKMVIELNNEMNLVFVHGNEVRAKAFLDNLARV